VVDAGIVSAIIFRNTARPDKPFFASIAPVIDGATLICSAAVYAEILYGAHKAKATRAEVAAINSSMQRFRIVWPNPQLADVYARMRASLPKGHGMSHKPAESDRWTAATAIMLNVPLLTTDSGYAGIPDLDHRYYPPVPQLVVSPRTIQAAAAHVRPARS